MFKTIALSTAALFAAGVATAQCSYSKTAQAEQRSETTDFGNATASAEAGIIAPVADPDLIDLAVSVENLSTLVTAVKAAGLVETLKGKGPFTIFAPTNKAFASLPSGTLESLLKPENKDKLVKVLTYHVVSGAYPSDQVKDGMKPASVEGSNGVVHVIDKVILPPGL